MLRPSTSAALIVRAARAAAAAPRLGGEAHQRLMLMPMDHRHPDQPRQPMRRWRHAPPTDTADSSSSSSSSSFAAFATKWNATLARRPQESVALFLSAQSTTWLVLYSSLASPFVSSVVSFPPELAAGWVVARLTKKFRQPANALLAAGTIKALPSLGQMKVTPLVTGFAGDANTRQSWNAAKLKLEESVPGSKKAVDAAARGIAWLEGPVDKYGLAFYLSGKVTSLTTLWASAYFIRQGVDVQSILDGWGLSDSVGAAAGTVAGAATCNAFLTPIHFAAVVGGVHGMEGLARSVRKAAPEGFVEEFRSRSETAAEGRRRLRLDECHDRLGKGGRGRDEQRRETGEEEDSNEGEETAEEFFENRFVDVAKLVLLLYALAVSMYALEVMKRTATRTGEEEDEEGSDETVEEEGAEEMPTSQGNGMVSVS